ncbi:rab9 effector protein with kelch motifs isoform X3 [Brachyhypopomus gauderio]|uniref:rab9 effector protein with kelch motifs isoform X3 n=1 Tax=Brachyhypopomus gauderio TaxID=698409 RepID=UPI004042F952
MELLPILDPDVEPRENQWYVVVPRGSGPGVTVGHTCTYVPSCGGRRGRVVVVGGADPNGSFSDSYLINLESHEWDIPDWPGLQARYELCSFTPQSDPESLWVFAGADQSSNRNSVQVVRTTGDYHTVRLCTSEFGFLCPVLKTLCVDSAPWRTVEVKGTPPGPRTYHTNSACVGDRLFVFSGGDVGATPVADPQVHIFDTVTGTWSQPETQGKPPCPRHGHAVVAVGSVIYVHGGMAGEKFHSDMFTLDTETMKWERVKGKGDIPAGTAAHAAVALGSSVYIFGGMTALGATNSMYKFQCDKHRWTLMKFESDSPPNRLDHSMCVVPWSGRAGGNTEEGAESSTKEAKHLCFVFGGMDTQGELFNDCLVTVLT